MKKLSDSPLERLAQCRGETVPPAGDVEVPRYDMSGFGDGMIEIAEGAFVYFDDHRAHVTRLTAERDALLAEVGRKTDVYQVKRAALTEERAKNDALQSELTKARELLTDVYMQNELSIHDDQRIDKFLNDHQSAPAAKGGE